MPEQRTQFRPSWISSPGETIADILSERHVTVSDFARQINESNDTARALLEGRVAITLTIARRLEGAIGGSVEFWMTRDYQYRQDAARLHEEGHTWLDELPVTDMLKFGWISPPPKPTEEVAAMLRFFEVPSIPAWRSKYAAVEQLVAFRTSKTFESRAGAVAAWIQYGERLARSADCVTWEPSRFRQALAQARALTRKKDAARFLPMLQHLCAASGVAFVVARSPVGCRASGATRFVSREKAMLLLSFRHLTDDHFWFTFFHEAGHLLLHGADRLFVEGLEEGANKHEEEANAFASTTLIPQEFEEELAHVSIEPMSVIRFARRAGVSPGIVVGQLQHMKRARRDQLNSLKRRFQWFEDGTIQPRKA